jgi:hypothetical protein
MAASATYGGGALGTAFGAPQPPSSRTFVVPVAFEESRAIPDSLEYFQL